MTDRLRVILEIGRKRRVAAGAMDWPGLDRWGTSEDKALERLAAYLPRYEAVADRAGLGRAYARARDVDVVERVAGSSSTDFWGVAHIPSHIEATVLSAADLDRRLDLLQACWAWFDDVAARVSRELRPTGRSGGRSREQIVRHVYFNEPEQYSRKVEVRTPLDEVAFRGRSGLAPEGVPGCDPRLERPGQARKDVADPVPDPPDRPARHGPRLGDGGPGRLPLKPRAVGGQEPSITRSPAI